MFSNARRSAAGFLFSSLIVGLFSANVNAQYTSRGPEGRVIAPRIPANAKDIVLKGEQVCLQRQPDANGRVLLDCAIGMRGDDDRFYGLRAADPTRIVAFPELNVRVRVTGKLIPNSGGAYVEAGQIVYASIEPIPGEPKPVTGTFMCVSAQPAGAPPVNTCRNTVTTDGGLHWGLDTASLDAIPAARSLAPGNRIALEGDIVQDVPEDWHPWMFTSEAERIQGVLKVRSLKRLAAP